MEVAKAEEPKTKAEKVEKPKKEVHKAVKKQKKNNLLAIACIALAAILLVVGIVFVTGENKLTIAGVEVKKDDYSVTIENATITAEDVEKLLSMEEVNELCLEKCSIQPALMKELCKLLELRMLEMNECNLSNEHLSNIDFSKLEYLWWLELQGNPQITELIGLEHVADSLHHLNIRGCSVTSLDVLSGSELIDHLDVGGNQLTSLKGIEQNLSLECLYAQNNQLTTLEGLENATILSDVNLRNNKITDMSILGKSAEKLRFLYIDNNPIGSLGTISSCLELIHLDADNCGLHTLNDLGNMEKLQQLSVANNSLTTLEGIGNNKELCYLDASNNMLISTAAIKDLAFTDANGYQGKVNLSNNALSGLEISDGAYISFLAIHGNKIVSLESVGSCDAYKLYLEYQDTIDFKKLAEANIDNFYIVNCPLDQQKKLEEILGTYYVEFVTAQEVQELIADEVTPAMQDE